MNITTKIGKVSNISLNTETAQLTFTLQYDIGVVKTVEVRCSGKLTEEIGERLKDGEEVTVIGSDPDNNFYSDTETVIEGIVVIISDNTVFPRDYPQQTAFKYRDDERERLEFRKTTYGIFDSSDPF